MEISGRDRLTCVRHRFRGTSCRACAGACPVGCLRLGPGLAFDSRACTDCGLCAAACPVQALPGATREVPEAVARLSRAKQAVIGCRSSPDGISTVRVACLGGLTALDLVVLAIAAAERELCVNLAFCGPCPVGADVLPVVRRRLDEAKQVLGEGGIRVLGDPRDAGMTPHQALRRGFLRSVLAPLGDVAPERAEAAGTLAGIPERRRHVLDHLHRLPKSSPEWLLAKTASCDDCCRCAGVCPTGALTRRRSDGRRVFEIASERCTGCGACVDFCPKDGVELSESTSARIGGMRGVSGSSPEAR